ncbi:uncharacterized protein METZ01_LOCUS513346 [marine metagenome]|uniref:Lcl C-terminal domain-containing protein n=1 Tax=marine metagenome TaxID=408172 RepID=A0A383EU92_9ZZZZ
MAEQRFLDNGDGTVTDTWTKLMWMQEDSFLILKKFLIYLHAQQFLDKLNSESFAGYSDWRFANKREAHSLFDKQKSVKDKYGCDIHIDPVFTAGCGYDTWTSHTRGTITAYCYSFNSGRGGHKESGDSLNTSVRFVRGEFDNSRLNITAVPQVRDQITQGGGWR